MIPTQQTPFQSASLYVGDLHTDITEGFLFEMFNRVGPVASIRVCRDTVTRRSLGYAYVNFHNVQDAERALDTMNFTDIKSKPCRIMWSQRDPSLRKSGVGNVFVKNLAATVDNKGLYDIFSVFGNILSCKVATDDNGVSKGYGYVHYETAEAAQEAIQKVNGHVLEEQEVFVGSFLKRQDRASSNEWTNLYAKQFPESWTEEKLTEVFSAFGAVSSVKLQVNADGSSKSFGFVDFAKHESAVKALAELNGKVFDVENPAEGDEKTTWTLYVSQAQKKNERLREIKTKVDALKNEQINKYQGMNLYVKNLDDTVTDEQFKEMFAPFGTITSARIMREESGANKGFAFICYATPDEATLAVTEMNGKMLGTKPLFVTLHQRKDHRRAHLAATHNTRGGAMGGNGPRYPMQTPMYPMGMYPGGPMPPRQAFPMINNMMPRGPRGVPANFAGRGGYPMPQYGMGGMQVNQQRRPQGVSSPQNGQRRVNNNTGRNQGGRGAPQQRNNQPNVKYTNQVRNQPASANAGQMAQQPATQTPAPMTDGALDHNSLALADPQTQKNMIGERLYPLILQHQPELAGKITGMLLEMDNAELLHLLESPDALLSKTSEALSVLQAHSSA